MSRPHDEVEYVLLLLTHAREELTRADQKASILLAATGVVFGSLISALLASSWSPSQLNSAIAWLWWAGLLLAAAGVTLLAASIYPSTRKSSSMSGRVSYFGDASSITRADLDDQVRDSFKDTKSALLDQLHAVTKIAATKYKRLSAGLLSLGGAAVACSIAIIVNAYVL